MMWPVLPWQSKSGNCDEAVADLEACLALDPANGAAKKELAEAKRRAAKAAKAEKAGFGTAPARGPPAAAGRGAGPPRRGAPWRGAAIPPAAPLRALSGLGAYHSRPSRPSLPWRHGAWLRRAPS